MCSLWPFSGEHNIEEVPGFIGALGGIRTPDPQRKVGALMEEAAGIVRTTITRVAVQDMKRDPAGA